MPGARAVAEKTGAAVVKPAAAQPPASIPEYLSKNYWWAYLRPASLRIFDHKSVVSAILWGQYNGLVKAALAEADQGAQVLQMACVYGDLSPRLAQKIGPGGALDIIDIAPIQVKNARHHLAGLPWAKARIGDAANPGAQKYDMVLSFFLLHELPENYKRAVVDSALSALKPGGKAVFVDYHRPARWHPLRPVQALVFALLEPFAKRLWRAELAEFASHPGRYHWQKHTRFAGFFQITVASSAPSDPGAKTV